ncbi:hypothetical protein [Lysinibacillus sphaericus]|uniref:hypothetical protein n=1 Tax=Lysinibacillus sphaericus TaxID=1421 RepID=UPI003D7F5169
MDPREPLSYLKDLLEDITHAVGREDEQTALHNQSDIINLKNVIDKYKALEIEVEHLRTIAMCCECNE